MCGELDGAGMRVLAVGGWGGVVVYGLGESEGVLWWAGGLGTASFHGYIYFLVFSIFILLYKQALDRCLFYCKHCR